MPRVGFGFLLLFAVCGMVPARAQGPARRVQPGLEDAVKWKWWVQPSEEKDWGVPVVEPAAPAEPGEKSDASGKKNAAARNSVSIPPGDYEVKRGDALAKISRRSGRTVDQLKSYNSLTGDTILIGQILKIPTLEEALAILPPVPPPVAKIVSEDSGDAKKPAAIPRIETYADLLEEGSLMQVFLDRENFSSGPIDGMQGPMFDRALGLYQGVHPELVTPEELREKAVAVAGHPFTSYPLKPADFRFIEAPKAPAKAPGSPSGSKRPKRGPAPPPPAPTFEELMAAEHLVYPTAWEFVAERFHCDEAFLRSLNPKIKEPPAVGTEFKVPNVIPFEVEKCCAGPLQPTADPGKPVVATIVGLSRLEIRQGGQLVAVMPVSSARPGLHGKGTWTVLNAIPRPRLVTRRELKSSPKPGDPEPPEVEQFLAPGPRNPVGVCWIHLAKANSSTPLPYGLHGTSIPSRMKTYESIGGFRLANWDIARAVRMLPEGTALQWK